MICRRKNSKAASQQMGPIPNFYITSQKFLNRSNHFISKWQRNISKIILFQAWGNAEATKKSQRATNKFSRRIKQLRIKLNEIKSLNINSTNKTYPK